VRLLGSGSLVPCLRPRAAPAVAPMEPAGAGEAKQGEAPSVGPEEAAGAATNDASSELLDTGVEPPNDRRPEGGEPPSSTLIAAAAGGGGGGSSSSSSASAATVGGGGEGPTAAAGAGAEPPNDGRASGEPPRASPAPASSSSSSGVAATGQVGGSSSSSSKPPGAEATGAGATPSAPAPAAAAAVGGSRSGGSGSARGSKRLASAKARRPSQVEQGINEVQDVIHTVLYHTTRLIEVLSAQTRSPTEEAEVTKLLSQISRNFSSLDHRFGARLSMYPAPLSAVKHLDEQELSLHSWCQGVAKELKAANADARHGAEQLLELAELLRLGGWAGKEPEADRLLMPPPAVAPVKKQRK